MVKREEEEARQPEARKIEEESEASRREEVKREGALGKGAVKDQVRPRRNKKTYP